MNTTTKLNSFDLEMFRRLGIDADLLERAGIRRVTDQEARQEFGLNGAGNNAGILFPYVDARGIRHTCRLRRDYPDLENGRPVRKYLAPYGDRRHLYIVPGDHHLGQDPAVPIVIVEAEKSALALRAWADRNGRPLLPIATGGCWGWRGRIGKVGNSRGERVDELGPLPELGICGNGREVFVLLDANCASNPTVRQARSALVAQLIKQKAKVHVLDLPAIEGVNGPDDYIGRCNDDAMTRLLDSPSKATDWRQLLIYRETRNGPAQPERVLANAITAFRYSPQWAGVLGFNEFSQGVEAREKTAWGKAAGPWTDADDSLATEWLQTEGGIYVTSTVVAESGPNSSSRKSAPSGSGLPRALGLGRKVKDREVAHDLLRL